MKSAVFNEFLAPDKSISVRVLPYLVLPRQSITVDINTRSSAFSSGMTPLLSVIHLGDAILSQQAVAAATIHIKDNAAGFFGTSAFAGNAVIGSD